jgi:serine/threonine-protein kinase
MLPVPDAVDYVLQALEAVAEAHSLGIVHRDLKPANLFLAHRADGSSIVKVLDFGISKVTSIPGGSSPEMALTKTAASMGSPIYMSPEQMVSSRDVDARTDIWAVGVILYELLSGQAPFGGETLPQLCAAILQHQPRMLGEMRHDVPPELEAVVRRCLDKTPANRFNNVGELAVALAPFAPQGSSISITRITGLFKTPLMSTSSIAVQPVQVSVGPVDTQSSTAVAWGQTGARSNSWKVPVIAAGAIVALLAVGGIGAVVAFGFMRQQADPEPATSSAALPSAPESALPADTTNAPASPDAGAIVMPTASASETPVPSVTARPPRTQPTPTPSRPPAATTTTPSKKKPPAVSDFGDRK